MNTASFTSQATGMNHTKLCEVAQAMEAKTMTSVNVPLMPKTAISNDFHQTVDSAEGNAILRAGLKTYVRWKNNFTPNPNLHDCVRVKPQSTLHDVRTTVMAPGADTLTHNSKTNLLACNLLWEQQRDGRSCNQKAHANTMWKSEGRVSSVVGP